MYLPSTQPSGKAPDAKEGARDQLFFQRRTFMRMLKGSVIVLVLMLSAAVWAVVPTTLNDFFLPGSQPNQSGQLETPAKCDNCHGGYNLDVEPAFNWRGSMMSQAARDPLFYACLTIGNQDAPESGDLCIRCHSPAGWLEGRSTPTDGSALNNNDRQSVQCDFCHKLVKPTSLGVNPYPDDSDYTSGTYPEDQSYLSTLEVIPESSANGMYIADGNNAKRGPFVDADAKHQIFYSPFHKKINFCGTCHDVSNPVYTRNTSGAYVPNNFDQSAPDFDPYSMFPIERTFSEWMMSEYNSVAGVYAPQFGGNKEYVSTCQDCHMRDVTGVGCNKPGVPIREDLPLHDQTGGNTFIPNLIESLFPGEPDTAALSAGIQRATYMLQHAASMILTVTEQAAGYLATVHVTNETGHKLPSGYPEGRRMWLNVKAYGTTGILIYESGLYDPDSAVLYHDPTLKVYEIKPGISEALAPIVDLPAGPSFHFVLNDTIYKDNRIPPRGFTNTNFETIQSPPVGYSYADGQYWDDTEYLLPDSSAVVVVTLYYQATSKEYVEFLRDENSTNDWGTTFYNLWAAYDRSAPVAMATQVDTIQSYVENQPPTLDSIGSKLVDEGQTLEFRVSATDPDGDSIILSAENVPTNAIFVDSGNWAGSFTFTPDFTQADTYYVTFIATDTVGAADSEMVQIVVNNVNRPPVLDSIGPKTVLEGDVLEFRIHATDADGDSIILDTLDVLTNATFTDSGNGAGSFTFAPDFTQADTYYVTFIASDTVGASDSEMVQIVVNNVNQPPVLDSIGHKTVLEGDTLEFRIYSTDADGDSIILDTLDVPTNATFIDSGNGAGSFTFAPDFTQADTYYVTFIASDTVGASDSEMVEIVVNNVNRPPVLDSIGFQAVLEGDTLEFRIHATDADLDSIVLDALNVPAHATFVDSGNGSGSFTFTPDFTQADTYYVSFIATDTLGAADSEMVKIAVTEASNHPPELDPIGPKTVTEGDTLEFRIHATDVDGDSVILAAENFPDNSTFVDSGNGSGSFTFTPDTTQAGMYYVTFKASDGILPDSEVVSIMVNEVNQVPSFSIYGLVVLIILIIVSAMVTFYRSKKKLLLKNS
jgi:hypothetical protein